jgi:hypothetical protein
MKDFGLEEEDCRLWVSCEARRRTNVDKVSDDNIDNNKIIDNNKSVDNDNVDIDKNNSLPGLNF